MANIRSEQGTFDCNVNNSHVYIF